MRSIEFGIVTRYFSKRGFGFVSRELSGSLQDHVFFHISKLEETFPELADAVKSQGDHESTFFWYEVGHSEKGPLVIDTFDYDDVTSLNKDDYLEVQDKIKSLWLNIDFQLPRWMIKVAKNTLSLEEFYYITSARELAISNIKAQRFATKVFTKHTKALVSTAEEEFQALVEEIRELEFQQSSEVSNYIVNRRLGLKYQNISGHLDMRKNGDTWTFNGGFPTSIYRRLCTKLGLSNNGSSAIPLRFTSYNTLKNHNG